ncbi:MAG: fumarylacetoacetate hydrolase family protein [Pseudomonadota bacterium]
MSNSASTPDGSRSDVMLTNIAETFVAARRSAENLTDYPGTVPSDLELAYRVQDIAIGLWPDSIVGWKVGQIRPEAREHFGTDRMLGPLFKRHVLYTTDSTPIPMPFFAGAFAVAEAEYVAVLKHDAPTDKQVWTLDESMAMVGDLRIGLETAGSPLPGLNEYGAAAVVSDFGAHGGLVVGPSIPGWRARNLDALTCEAYVDDKRVGTGGTVKLHGGIARSMQVALENTTARGRPLNAGDVISTGAATGVHPVAPGQVARIEFGSGGAVACRVIAATAVED